MFLTIVQIIGSISTLLCVYLFTKQHVLSWSVGIVGCISYLILFFHNNLFGESILQVVFILQSLYGWYYWKSNNTSIDNTIISLLPNTLIFHIIGTLILSIGLFYLLKWSYLDILISLLSLLATYYLMKRYLQSWYIWIFVDILSVYLFIYRGLYITAVLYYILGILAIIGLQNWEHEKRK